MCYEEDMGGMMRNHLEQLISEAANSGIVNSLRPEVWEHLRDLRRESVSTQGAVKTWPAGGEFHR